MVCKQLQQQMNVGSKHIKAKCRIHNVTLGPGTAQSGHNRAKHPLRPSKQWQWKMMDFFASSILMIIFRINDGLSFSWILMIPMIPFKCPENCLKELSWIFRDADHVHPVRFAPGHSPCPTAAWRSFASWTGACSRWGGSRCRPTNLIGGLNPSEKYESQLVSVWLFYICWKIWKKMFQSTQKLLLSPVMPSKGDFNSWLNMAMIEAFLASRSWGRGHDFEMSGIDLGPQRTPRKLSIHFSSIYKYQLIRNINYKHQFISVPSPVPILYHWNWPFKYYVKDEAVSFVANDAAPFEKLVCKID